MLKRWLLAPLNDHFKLNERLDSIEDMIAHGTAAQALRFRL